MKSNELSWVCSGITILTSLAVEDIIRVVLLVLGCISAVVSLSYNIYCWWRKAKQDGKIDINEVKELKDTLDKGIDDIKSLTNKEDKDNG